MWDVLIWILIIVGWTLAIGGIVIAVAFFTLLNGIAELIVGVVDR